MYRTLFISIPCLLFTSLLCSSYEAKTLYFDPFDNSRERTIPIKIYMPENNATMLPVVVYSHGLGGSREGKAYLGHHWAESGFIGVFVQHPGSDNSVWQGLQRDQIFDALKKAASPKSFMNRTKDIPFVLDYLTEVNADPEHPLYDTLDLTRIAMTGHSFGAKTTQAMMGEKFTRMFGFDFEEERFGCFISMSPSGANRISNQKAFGHIEKPVLCMTGTLDTSVITPDKSAESRLEVYNNLPAGNKYQVNFFEGTHNIFSGSENARNTVDTRFPEAIKLLTTQFLRAYLNDDSEALRWLQSEEVYSQLIIEDTWEWK